MNSDDIWFDTTQAEDTGTPWWELDTGSSSDGYDIPDNMIPFTLGDGSVYYIQATESPTGELVYTDYTDSAGPIPITYNEDGTVDAEKSAWDIAGKIGQTAWNALKGAFVKPDGSINWAGLATAGAGLYAATGGNKASTPNVYQGTIPKLTAVREAVNYDPTVDPRKAGSYGRRYFSDTTYVPEGGDLAAARTAAKTQALKTALPNNWSTYSPEQKIEYFNRNKVTPDQLLGAGEAQSDLDWMAQHGYTGAPTAPDYSGLPTGWSMYTPQQKIEYFNQNGMQADELVKYGVPSSDLDWMKLHGYTGLPTLQGFAQGGAVPEFKGSLESGGFVMNGAAVRGAGGGDREQGLKALHQALGAQAIRGPGTEKSDSIPTSIDGKQPAAVANGEAYVPRQQVAQVGGGDVNQGAAKLMTMMNQLRQRGDTPKRYATGGVVDAGTTNTQGLAPWVGEYATSALAQGAAAADLGYQPYTGKLTASESPLQTQAFAGIGGLSVPTEVSGAASKAEGVADKLAGLSYTPSTITSGYAAPEAYTGTNFSNTFTAPEAYSPTQITSGYSTGPAYKEGSFDAGYKSGPAYSAADFSSANYAAPEAYAANEFSTDNFDAAAAQQYMNPYMAAALTPQLEEAKRQAQLTRLQDAARLTKAGAYGGTRQAVMESELNRNLLTNLGNITAQGYNTAYQQGREQFNADQLRALQASQATEASKQFGYSQKMTAADKASQYGLAALQAAEQSKQFGANYSLQDRLNAAQFTLEAQKAREQSRQFGANYGLQDRLNAAQLGLTAQQASEQSKQFGYGQQMAAAQLAAQLDLAAQQASEQSKQFGYGQQMIAAQQDAQYGLAAQQASEQSKQFGANYGLEALNAGLTGYTTAANLGLAGLNAEKGILGAQLEAGAQQRALESEQVAADMAQFEAERDYAANAAKYKLGLLSGLPIGATSSEANTTGIDQIRTDIAGLMSLYNTLSGKTTGAAK